MSFLVNRLLCTSDFDSDLEQQLTVWIRKGHLKRVKQLVRKGADVNFRNSSGQTFLHMSVIYSHWKCVEFLLQSKAINKNPVDCCGATPLMRACSSGNVGIVDILLQHGCSVNYHSNTCTAAIHYTLTSFCCVIPTIDSTSDSITYQSSREIIGTVQKHYYKSGKYFSLLSLLAAGCDVNVQNRMGKTPLHQAVEEFNIEAVKLLIRHSCSLDTEAKYEKPIFGLTSVTPVLLAVFLKQLPVIEILLEFGCDVKQLWIAFGESESFLQMYVYHFVFQPKPLKLLCRNKIRSVIELPVIQNVFSLQIPVPMKKYLLQIAS